MTLRAHGVGAQWRENDKTSMLNTMCLSCMSWPDDGDNDLDMVRPPQCPPSSLTTPPKRPKLRRNGTGKSIQPQTAVKVQSISTIRTLKTDGKSEGDGGVHERRERGLDCGAVDLRGGTEGVLPGDSSFLSLDWVEVTSVHECTT